MTNKAKLPKELLPPHVSLYRRIIQGKMTVCYTFFHHVYGSLGNIYFTPASGHQLYMQCEVAGVDGAPMTETRKGLLKQLSELMPSQIESVFGKGDGRPPAMMENRGSLIESKMLVCLKCDVPVSFLIFATHTPTPSEGNAAAELEDYACLMHHKIIECNLPTWVIGDSDELGNEIGYAWVLKIWPNREWAKPMRSDELNGIFDILQTTHCKGQLYLNG